MAVTGLQWDDLFPDRPSQPLRLDPEAQRRRQAEQALRDWRDRAKRKIRDRLYRKHKLITKGEQLLEQKSDRGWELLALGYLEFEKLEWLADLLDAKQPEGWRIAKEFLN